MTTQTDIRVIGFNDEQTHCDRCGKLELRGTVIAAEEGAELGRYGTTCVSYILPSGEKTTRARAKNIEDCRRDYVMSMLKKAEKYLRAGDNGMALDYLKDATRRGMHRPDELQRAENIRIQAEERNC